MRLLHQRHDHDGCGPPRRDAAARAQRQVREALAGNLCRCGTHGRIIRAVLRAAKAMGKS